MKNEQQWNGFETPVKQKNQLTSSHDDPPSIPRARGNVNSWKVLKLTQQIESAARDDG